MRSFDNTAIARVDLNGSIWLALSALAGGLIVGVASGLAAYFLDPIFDGGVASVFPFLIMVLILLIRPTGLFGWKTIERI